jgi:uncharacterized protein (TIGR02246 family)
MKKGFRSLLLLGLMTLLLPGIAVGGPVEEVDAVVDRWIAAFNANDVNALVKNYASDATFVGTVGTTLGEGSDAIRHYYARLKGTGDSVEFRERKTVLLCDEVAYVSGIYEFHVARNGKERSTPDRFTMILIKRGSDWEIAHHHSSRSPNVSPVRVRRAIEFEHDFASLSGATE